MTKETYMPNLEAMIEGAKATKPYVGSKMEVLVDAVNDIAVKQGAEPAATMEETVKAIADVLPEPENPNLLAQ